MTTSGVLRGLVSGAWNGIFNSFAEPLNVAVVGATGGVGRALVNTLAESSQVKSVMACSRTRPSSLPQKCNWSYLDLTDEASIKTTAIQLGNLCRLDLVIVATGTLHSGNQFQPEKSWRALEQNSLSHAFMINSIGPALVGKHFLPLLTKGRKSVFAALSARVGSITDNRSGGWHSYRASKAALNMILKNFALELEHRNPCAICLGLHPGTVRTPLSEPFCKNTPDEKLFSPEQAVNSLITVIDAAEAQHSGSILAWDGRPVDP